MQLFTQHNFTVVRQIADHTDVTTYYVRAVIRNAYTDEIIETLNLTDKTGQRFKKDWRVPADPSGEGFYISIVTSVYTDSGYTTKSSAYGDEENTYLVIDKPRNTGGSGGTGSLARRDIRDIISEELEKVVEKIKPKEKKETKIEFPKFPKIPKDRTDEVLKAIKAIPKPEKQKEVDFKPVMQSLEEVKKNIADKDVTPETDLNPVIEKIESVMNRFVTVLENIGEALVNVAKETITNEVNNMKWKGTVELVSGNKKDTNKAEGELEEALDITKLTS